MSGGLAVSATAPDGSASAASRKAALEYLDLGYALLPLKGKTPHYQVLKSVYGGTEWAHLRRPTSPTEVEEWLAVDPSLDIGIQTGRVSNNLVVVDFDRRGGEDLIPSTPVVKTTRGLHLYVEGDQTVASQRCTHGEIRADGLYVAAPPSIHPSGARYEWLRHPNEVALLPVAELDEQLVRLLTSGAEADGQGTSPSADTPPSTCTRGGLEGSLPDFSRWDTDEAIVRRYCDLLSIPFGKGFCCLLPGHEESHPSASLYREPLNRAYVYRCFHHRGAETANGFLTLSSAYASWRSGQVRQLAGPEQAVWMIKLLRELGVLKPIPVTPLQLPPGLTRRAYAFYDAFLQRYAVGGGQPVRFTWAFAEFWCGLARSSEYTGLAFKQLMSIGAIVRVGDDGRSGLFVPGRSLRTGGGS
jgi:Bifunctional DNA primase/polymerase, N-terminal